MMIPIRSDRCEFARRAASLRLDGELSEFEGALLDAHLRACAECRAFALDVIDLTHAVRTTPLVPVDRSFVPQRRRAGAARMRALSAATAVAAVVVLSVGLASSRPGSQRDRLRDAFEPTIAQINAIESDDVLVRDLKFTPPRPPKIGL